jgi:hypothetical protein
MHATAASLSRRDAGHGRTLWRSRRRILVMPVTVLDDLRLRRLDRCCWRTSRRWRRRCSRAQRCTSHSLSIPRVSSATAHAVEHWRPSYKRATVMPASLAVVGSLLAIAAWLVGASLTWFLAARFSRSVHADRDVADEQTTGGSRSRYDQRARSQPAGPLGRLHAIRSGLSLVALVLMLFATP